ncbi:MAG TPA: sigma-70 family RNA polymerase sigma factor [Chitinophaga sp.]|uniref:sigma-70 family RNA polymerase sigma factor n=1 Tax=Chitinophaga sp. TaxID=1869181 RepID=UPI002DBE2BE6|nr:sigma-70 family RNA polymerase sigma factor [Chitinophaga sp.]HEU4551301.1 sigma-70 family RNA polymerase sigma factor [Chitinophaga sp.]
MTGQPNTTLKPSPDEELIARILKGEKRLFELIIRKYNQRLYRIGMSILDNEAEAEDAMQTAYIKAYEHLSGFEQRSSFATWLTRIMLNQCYEQKRKNRHVFTNIEQPDNFINMKTPENELAGRELNNMLQLAIAQLPEKYRLVFVLREIEDLSVRDTSLSLDIEETNVKVRLNRAKAMLRENLNSYMKDHVYNFHLTKCDRITNHVLGHLGIV